MQEFINVTGIILKTAPIGEYDRRMTLLTKERGKIGAFVRGARKPANRMGGLVNPFSFGVFKLYEGKNSYTVAEAEIINYFEELRKDYEGAYYGMYFCEIADYYCRENNDEKEVLKLLYQSLRALCAASIPHQLVRCVYELRMIVIQGEYPGIPTDQTLHVSTKYALNYIAESPMEKLYTFGVIPKVLEELCRIAGEYRNRYLEGNFKSLEIIESLESE